MTASDKNDGKKIAPQAGSDGAGKAERRPRGGNHARKMQRAEKEITRLEGQLAALEEECALYATDYQKLMELEAQKEALNTALMEQYERWEALSDEA